MDLKKETLCIRRNVCRRQTELITESDCIVPDTKPDIGKILEVTGRANVTECRSQGDKVMLSGHGDFTLLYVPETGETGMVESVEFQLPFKDVCTDISGTGLSSRAALSGAEALLLNSRKVSLRGKVLVQLFSEETETVNLSVGVENDAAQVKTAPLFAQSSIFSGSFRRVVGSTEEVPSENPPMANFLKADAQIMEEDVKLITGKKLVQGAVRHRTLFTDDLPALPPVVMEHALPFTEILDMPGTEEGMGYTLELSVGDILWQQDTDDEAGRRFGAEVTMDIRAAVFDTGNLPVLSDCFVPGMETTLRKTAVPLQIVGDRVQELLSLRRTLSLPAEMPSIAAVCAVNAEPEVTHVEMNGNEAEIEGEAAVTLLYIAEGGPWPVEVYTDKIPFSLRAAVTPMGEGALSCRARVLDASCTLPDTESVDVRLTLEFDMHYTAEMMAETVSEVTLSEIDASARPSIVIAFPKTGETLWDVGKRYGVSIEKIAAANGLEPRADEAVTGRLLVP